MNILLIVDPQYDFIDGTLPVPEQGKGWIDLPRHYRT